MNLNALNASTGVAPSQPPNRFAVTPPAFRPAARFRPSAAQLGWLGAAFLGLAGVFFWRDLNLGIEFVLVVVALGLLAAVLTRWPRSLPDLGVYGLLACGLGGGAWFVALSPPPLLWGLGVAFAAALAAILRAPGGDAPEAASARDWAWRAFAANLLALSFGLYFQFLTLGVAADELGRRLVLTGGWLASGLVLVVAGQWRKRDEIIEAGSAVAIAALLKASFYDTTHLGGPLRIAAMVLTGALLLGAALLLPRHGVDQKVEAESHE